MMMQILLSRILQLSIVLLLFGRSALAQQAETLTIDQLQSLAKENYPLLKQEEIYNAIGENKSKAYSSNYLPQAIITGQATLQSEVTTFNFSAPGSTPFEVKPDQYSIGLELRENLLNYGMVKTQKQIETQTVAIQMQQVEIDFQKLKDRINQLYGNISLQKENKKIMMLRLNEINSKRSRIKSAVDNGAALQSSFLVLESEYLTTSQKMEEVNTNLISWSKSLSILTGHSIDTSSVFSTQITDVQLQTKNQRPEYKLFELQQSTFHLRELMVSKTALPKLFVFGRGYYGRPGYNFLNNDFRTYGIVGAGLSWNLSAYYTSSKDTRNYRLNNDIISNQKRIFDMNLESTLFEQQQEITKLQNMLALDSAIVNAKTIIRKVSSSQLDNGVITPSDYITDLNGESQAQFNLKLHEIQLLLAKENYNTTMGY